MDGFDGSSASRLGSQLWYAGRNSGSPLAGTWNSHERSRSNARVLQWDAEQPRNGPELRGAVLGAAPGRSVA